MRPIKVLQILPSLETGGVEQGTLDLSAYLVSQGHFSFVCSSGGRRTSELESHGAVHLPLPVHSKNIFTIWQNKRRLAALIQSHQIQIVHVRSRAPAWSAYDACRTAGIPLVTTFHGTYNFKNSLKKLYNSIMARGDHVIAISDFIKHHILENYASFLSPTSNITVIHRGIDTSFFDPETLLPEQLNKAKQDLGINPEKKVLLMPGRLVRWKGHEVVIDALSFLKELDIVCLLVGPSQGRERYKAELLRKITQKGLREHVRFLEPLWPMPLLYGMADIVLHASTDPEAFGRVVAEAQAMGKPVISNELGAPREILLCDETGWLVPSRHPQKLAEKIRFVLNLSPTCLKELAHKARQHCRSRFTKERMCRETLGVYEELLRA